jgi:hypothetical protein
VNVPKSLSCALAAALAWWSVAAAPTVQSQESQPTRQTAERLRKAPRIFPIKKFYDTANLAPGKAGELIRSQEFEQYDLAEGVLAVRILYHSRSANGQDVPVSGVVLYPDGKPPAHGWPVIAWAHALHGVARQCAPSLSKNLQHGPFLSMYVKLGYAVVATDYAGLGTAVRNVFADAQSNATDVIYSVAAARAAVHGLDARWVAVGIGEGGAAVAALAELEGVQDQNYLGSLAISNLDDPQNRYRSSTPPTFFDSPLFLAFGIKTDYPEFDIKDLLTEQGISLYPRVEQSCAEPVIELKRSPSEVLKPNWAGNKFVKIYFSRSTLGEHPAKRPLMVIASELDSTIPIHMTAQVIARMCKQGDRVQFERLAESGPGSIFGESVRDQISWMESRFAGRPAESNCSEKH